MSSHGETATRNETESMTWYRPFFCISIFIPLCFIGCTTRDLKKELTNGLQGKYPIRHTGVHLYYDTLSVISEPDSSSVFFDQDAASYSASTLYTDHGDGTITDLVTGLMWTRNATPKSSLEEAHLFLHEMNQGKYNDWRIPSIKELFSLMDYSGQVFGDQSKRLFIHPDYFIQPLGNSDQGERQTDAQTWSSTACQSLTMGKDQSRYGVNFIDGRVKAYPITNPSSGKPNQLHFRFVRGNPHYGFNLLVDNGDGTVTDQATGLMWQKEDSKTGLDWKSAFEYARDLELAGHSDWRLPTVKELQSLVEYENDIDQSHQASISTLFQTSKRNHPDGTLNYPYYWSSTTLLDGPRPGNQAAYVCFGKASAFIHGKYLDAHGTGAVRSDFKYLQPIEYPFSFGPQGDLVYVRNMVRCVRDLTR